VYFKRIERLGSGGAIIRCPDGPGYTRDADGSRSCAAALVCGRSADAVASCRMVRREISTIASDPLF
jgi:hypothetical protein